MDLDDLFASDPGEEAEVPDNELLIHRLGLLMELPFEVAFAEPVHQVLKLALSGMLLKFWQEVNKHTDLIMADLV